MIKDVVCVKSLFFACIKIQQLIIYFTKFIHALLSSLINRVIQVKTQWFFIEISWRISSKTLYYPIYLSAHSYNKMMEMGIKRVILKTKKITCTVPTRPSRPATATIGILTNFFFDIFNIKKLLRKVVFSCFVFWLVD